MNLFSVMSYYRTLGPSRDYVSLSEWQWSRRAASSRIVDGIPSGESCEVSEKHSAYARSLAPKSCPYSGQLAHSQRNFYSSPFAPPHGQACVTHIRRKTQPVAPPSPPTPCPFRRRAFLVSKDTSHPGSPSISSEYLKTFLQIVCRLLFSGRRLCFICLPHV